MSENTPDSDVTNDTTKPVADTWSLDTNQSDKIPVYGQGKAIYDSGKKLFGDPVNNLGELANIGGQVAALGSTYSAVVADPLNWLISQGVGFLIDFIQPLEDLLGMVTGNPERMQGEMDKWQRVGEALVPLSEEIRAAGNHGLATWEGKAGEAAKTRLNDFADGVAATANDVKHVLMIMNIAKLLMEIAKAFLEMIIATFVQWLIMIWIPALAAAVPTAGGSTAAAGTATTAQAASTTSKATTFTGKVQRILQKLRQALARQKDYAITDATKKFAYMKDGVFKIESAGEAIMNNVIKKPGTYFNPVNGFKAADTGLDTATYATQEATNEYDQSSEETTHDLDPNR